MKQRAAIWGLGELLMRLVLAARWRRFQYNWKSSERGLHMASTASRLLVTSKVPLW
jgi:hypothetical protein